MNEIPQKPSYVHRGGDTSLLGATIWSFFEKTVASYPQGEALVSIPQGKRLTFAEFQEEASKLAKGLLALNIGRGDRVGIWSTNNLEWVLLQMATARIGAVLVNINPAYPAEELHHALSRARVQVLFLIPSFRTSHYVQMVCELCPEAKDADPEKFACSRLPDLRCLVVYDPVDVEHTKRPEAGFLTWREILAKGADVSDEALSNRAATLDPDDPINIQFTSGTTGFPKAVLLTHHNIINNGYFTGKIMHFGPE